MSSPVNSLIRTREGSGRYQPILVPGLNGFGRFWRSIGRVKASPGAVRAADAFDTIVHTYPALLGVESLVVNQGVKRLFRRERPTTTGDDRLPVRTPTTSSFP